MKLWCDLHIHSCLSPCGDELMTPNNLVNMAAIKGLEMIAVSDHNSARNLPAVQKVAWEVGVCLIPAIEFTTREEVHLLGYFPGVEAALEVSDAVYPHLLLPNRPEIFGPQQVMNEQDEQIDEVDKLLIQALDLSIDELVDWIHRAGGAAVPAHINRGSNGILNVLGFLPENGGYDALEVSPSLPVNERLISGYRTLHSSDAHRLEDILERVEQIDLNSVSARGFVRMLRRDGPEKRDS